MKTLTLFILTLLIQGCASVEESPHIPANVIRGDQTVGEAQTFTCSISTTKQKFEASGPTLLQTKKALIDECSKSLSQAECIKNEPNSTCKKNL